MRIPLKLLLLLGALTALAFAGIGAGAVLLLSDDGGTESVGGPERTGKGYLGLTVTFLPSQGLRVATVAADGPAGAAGLQVGDIIRSVDGEVVRTPEQLRNAVESKAPGTQVTITYERGDRETQARVKLGDAPASAQIEGVPTPATGQGLPRMQNQQLGQAQLGVQVANITPELKQRYSLARDNGAVVVSVQPGSGAANAGMRPGDIILAVNDRSVSTADEVARAVAAATAASPQVNVKLLRATAETTVQVQVRPAASVPGLQDVQRQLQQLLQLLQGAGLSAEQLRQLERAGASFPGNHVRFGELKQVGAASIVVTEPASKTDYTFAVTSQTEVRRGGERAQVTDLSPGSDVLVISVDGQTATAIVAFGR